MLYIPFPKDRDYVGWCKSLISRRLAASINVLPAESFFFWESELRHEEEVIIIIKTSRDKVHDLKKTVESEHPYKVPAIIELAVVDANQSYLKWVEESTRG